MLLACEHDRAPGDFSIGAANAPSGAMAAAANKLNHEMMQSSFWACASGAIAWPCSGRFDGEPTRYAPKAVGLWGMVAFALAIRLLIWATSTYVPEKVHGAEIGLLLFSVFVGAVHVLTLRAAARAN